MALMTAAHASFNRRFCMNSKPAFPVPSGMLELNVSCLEGPVVRLLLGGAALGDPLSRCCGLLSVEPRLPNSLDAGASGSGRPRAGATITLSGVCGGDGGSFAGAGALSWSEHFGASREAPSGSRLFACALKYAARLAPAAARASGVRLSSLFADFESPGWVALLPRSLRGFGSCDGSASSKSSIISRHKARALARDGHDRERTVKTVPMRVLATARSSAACTLEASTIAAICGSTPPGS